MISFVVGVLALGLGFVTLVSIGHGLRWLIPSERAPWEFWSHYEIKKSFKVLMNALLILFAAICIVFLAFLTGTIIIHNV